MAAATKRMAFGHLRWLQRGVNSGQALMVAGYLVFLALAVGMSIGYLAAPRGGISSTTAFRTPPPVTPPPPGTKWVEVQTTGYCPCAICCGKDADGFTAINRKVERYPYGIAVEPKLIPYRSWLQVPGYGEAMVDDTGGAMRQSAKRGVVHLDLRFKTHETARQWGRRWQWIAIPEQTPAADSYGIGREEFAVDP